MIKEAYCSYQVARLLREKGFDEPCAVKYCTDGNFDRSFYHYKNSEINKDAYNAPTQQMAMAWLREKNISIEPSALNAHLWAYTIYKLLNNKVKELYNDGGFDSYEEAVEAALKYVLENLI